MGCTWSAPSATMMMKADVGHGYYGEIVWMNMWNYFNNILCKKDEKRMNLSQNFYENFLWIFFRPPMGI
jgi:hypothetical protein